MVFMLHAHNGGMVLKNTLCVAGGGAKTHGCVSMRQHGEDEVMRRGGKDMTRGGEEEARGISRSVSMA